MVESGSQSARLSLGEDLVAGHVHARQSPDTAGSDVSPRIKRRLRAKTSLAEIEREERGRSRVPEPPRLRSLNQDPADVPIPEGSLVPCSSPTSGQNRAYPYTPVSNAVGSSSFEFVPSAGDRAASERGLSESMETIPILRSSSSPSILHKTPQVMSPNLVAGSASNATHSGSGIETDAGVQAILQQWQEVKTEHGTVERTYAQCAQAWPLADNVKMENMESAILILRQACGYLHSGMTRLSSITAKSVTPKRCRRELRADLDQCVADVKVLRQHSTEYQMDLHARDSELFELKELISISVLSWMSVGKASEGFRVYLKVGRLASQINRNR